jgi:hypothetical protein
MNGIHQFSLNPHSVLTLTNNCELFQGFDQRFIESKIK